MEGTPENKIEKTPEDQYSELINAYKGKVRELKKLARRVPQGVVDEEVLTAVRVIDKERHETHLKLIDLGRQMGKTKDDVIADILRKDGSLEEYGLPEFSILTENDIIQRGDWDGEYYFNVDLRDRRPSTKPSEEYFKENGESFIKPNEVMLVFAIVPIEDWGETELKPEDYDERVKRAKALAQEVGAKVFEEPDYGNHEASAKILGVIILSKDLEKVATLIRDNPKKYRIGKEFY